MENFWFDGYPALSHNCLFTFIQSMRGPGKTFWAKKWCFTDFIKNKRQFIYLRRYKSETKKQKNFPAQVADQFPGHEFKMQGNQVYIDNELAGFLCTLSVQLTEKGVNYDNVNKIIFDEFQLPPHGTLHYLHNEVGDFLNFYETVNRLRLNPVDEVRVVFLANFEGFNPYYDFFHINLDRQGKYRKKDYIYAERWYNKNFVDAKKNTRFGKLIAGTNYGDYAIEGERFDRDDTMIAARPQDAVQWYNISVLGKIYGVWGSKTAKMLVISNTFDPSMRVFCLARPDVKGGMELILPRDPRIKSLAENYRFGMVYYETLSIREKVAPAIGRMV